jgi:hypothetical protein
MRYIQRGEKKRGGKSVKKKTFSFSFWVRLVVAAFLCFFCWLGCRGLLSCLSPLAPAPPPEGTAVTRERSALQEVFLSPQALHLPGVGEDARRDAAARRGRAALLLVAVEGVAAEVMFAGVLGGFLSPGFVVCVVASRASGASECSCACCC